MTTRTHSVELTDQHGPILVGEPNDHAMRAWHRGCFPIRQAANDSMDEALVPFSAAGNDW